MTRATNAAPLGALVARGRTAEIHAWDTGRVLKLFRAGWTADAVAREAANTRQVHAAGLPVPAVEDVVEIEGRLGLVFERVEGRSLLEGLRQKPWRLFGAARLLAELHAAIHAHGAPELPPQRERLEGSIHAAGALPPDLKEAVLQALRGLPAADSLCHGDFHPDNILMTAAGPVLIDWLDATQGNPLADVARTSLLLQIGAPPPDAPLGRLLETGRGWFRRAYLQRYFRLRPADRRQLEAWQPVIAAARLNDAVPGEQERLLALVRQGLSL